MERKFTLNPYNSVEISEELSFTFSIQPISKKKGLFDMFRKTSHEHNVTFRIVNVKGLRCGSPWIAHQAC